MLHGGVALGRGQRPQRVLEHRQVQDGDLKAVRITAQRGAVPVQDVDLGLQHRLVRRQVAAIGLLSGDPQRPALP